MQRLHAAGGVRLDVEAVDRFPRRVPFGGGGPHAVQRVDAIGHDDERVEVEELRDVVGVVLNLVERLVDGGLVRVRILQFEDHQRQAVDVDDDVRAAVVLAVDGQLVDDAEVVVVAGRPSRWDRAWRYSTRPSGHSTLSSKPRTSSW